MLNHHFRHRQQRQFAQACIKPDLPDNHVQGLPCKHGHSGIRLKSNGACVTCKREYARTYRAPAPVTLEKWAEQPNGHKMFLVTLFDIIDNHLKLGTDRKSQMSTYLFTVKVFYDLLAIKERYV